jgi:hypothetical protein
MAIIQICDFGERNGIRMYRVHGDKIDLEKILQTCLDEDAKFEELPVLEYTRKGVWTFLLKIKVPVGVGGEVE